MEHIEYYKAYDWKEFDNGWDCVEYELNSIYKGVKFFDKNINELNITTDDIEAGWISKFD